MQSIWSVGIYGSSKKKNYWNAVNWIFRYHIDTCDYRILFEWRACIEALGYVNANYVKNLDFKSSMINHMFKFPIGMIC